jgi:hypothetical protein
LCHSKARFTTRHVSKNDDDDRCTDGSKADHVNGNLGLRKLIVFLIKTAHYCKTKINEVHILILQEN